MVNGWWCWFVIVDPTLDPLVKNDAEKAPLKDDVRARYGSVCSDIIVVQLYIY